MFEIASQIVICLLLATLIGAIIGFLLGKATCGKGKECQHPADDAHELHINHHNHISH